MNTIAVIIPALERNTYHEQGDLAPFGDVSLLEWKLTQVKKVVPGDHIYISTPSAIIKDFSRKNYFQVIERDENLSLSEMIAYSISAVSEEIILWTNVTAPFFSTKDYNSCINAFMKLDRSYDSLLTVFPLREYVFFDKQPLNFMLHQHISRRNIKPAYIMTNGCFIIRKEIALRCKSYIGNNPFLYDMDKLTSLEIKDIDDLTIANDLLAIYMKNKEL